MDALQSNSHNITDTLNNGPLSITDLVQILVGTFTRCVNNFVVHITDYGSLPCSATSPTMLEPIGTVAVNVAGEAKSVAVGRREIRQWEAGDCGGGNAKAAEIL